jgi:hypothetical protein
VLRVHDRAIKKVDEMKCVVFHQKYEHHGRPFLDGEKVLLRSKLIFKDENFGHQNSITELFSRACYMTGQNSFDGELSAYAHQCFERANSMHWSKTLSEIKSPLYLLKSFQGLSFLTDAYNYWFRKNPETPDNVIYCAVVAVLDYLNCKTIDGAFRSVANTQTVRRRFSDEEDIWNFLPPPSSTVQCWRGMRPLNESAVKSLMPEERDSSQPFVGQLEGWHHEEPEYLED